MPYTECPHCGEFYRSRSLGKCPKCKRSPRDATHSPARRSRRLGTSVQTSDPRSSGTAVILTGFVGLGLVLHVASLGIAVVAAISPAIYSDLLSLDGLLIFISSLGSLLSGLLLLIWLTLVTFDLRHLDPDYEVSVPKTVVRIWLPVYNTYGIYATLRELAEYFKGSGGTIGEIGSRIQFTFLLVLVSSVVLNLFLPSYADPAFVLDEGIVPFSQLVSRIWYVGYVLAVLLLVMGIAKALRLSWRPAES